MRYQAQQVPSTEQIEALEKMVDTCGLKWVLSALGRVCQDKADHVREAWQDESLAQSWEDAESVCNLACEDPRADF